MGAVGARNWCVFARDCTCKFSFLISVYHVLCGNDDYYLRIGNFPSLALSLSLCLVRSAVLSPLEKVNIPPPQHTDYWLWFCVYTFLVLYKWLRRGSIYHIKFTYLHFSSANVHLQFDVSVSVYVARFESRIFFWKKEKSVKFIREANKVCSAHIFRIENDDSRRNVCVAHSHTRARSHKIQS